MRETIAVFQTPRPHIRRVPVDRPWAWLTAGWRDLVSVPAPALACGLVPVAVGWLITCLLLWFDLPYLVLPLGAGFFFVGPFLAVGLYEISRRRELKLAVDAETTFTAWKRNSEQIAGICGENIFSICASSSGDLKLLSKLRLDLIQRDNVREFHREVHPALSVLIHVAD